MEKRGPQRNAAVLSYSYRSSAIRPLLLRQLESVRTLVIASRPRNHLLSGLAGAGQLGFFWAGGGPVGAGARLAIGHQLAPNHLDSPLSGRGAPERGIRAIRLDLDLQDLVRGGHATYPLAGQAADILARQRLLRPDARRGARHDRQ